jgi:hypothetical protein
LLSSFAGEVKLGCREGGSENDLWTKKRRAKKFVHGKRNSATLPICESSLMESHVPYSTGTLSATNWIRKEILKPDKPSPALTFSPKEVCPCSKSN